MIGRMLPILLICSALLPPVLVPVSVVPVGPVASVVPVASVDSGSVQARTSPHDRAFWQAIVKADYAVPPNEQVVPLARELSAMLASPDPELRDDFGYSILAAWIFQKRLIQDAPLRALIAEWTKNLDANIGSTDTDDVFRRSFSALMLSVAVARDNATPYLDAAEVRTLLAASLSYLARERDVRGYDADKGWMHSAAHTADLLKFLARSRHLPTGAQQEILDAIAAKLRTAPIPYAFGEDQRFARAVLSIINRSDFDRQVFDAWLQRAKPTWPKAGRPDAALVRGNLNLSNLLAKLYVILSQQPQPGEGARAALEGVSAAVKTLF
jgi:hypothetical protein